MGGFTKFQVASSIPLAAQNEGGMAGIGAGLGAGVAVGQAMAQGMSGAMAQPPPPQRLPRRPKSDRGPPGKLKGLLDKGLISAADYDSTKAELLKKLIG
jgi:membrane protease subunit (stomatin/prohibitin family)